MVFHTRSDLLRILKKGVKAWNAWREKHLRSYVKIDLNGANLREANLSGANLSGANLSGANLREANLSGANLSGANLSWTNLIEADLSDSDLIEADLNNARLAQANLRNANLNGSDLTNVIFATADGTSANMTGAVLIGARFTPASESIPEAGFLELAAAEGIEKACFGNPELLRDYLAEAFEYAHREDLSEAKRFPDFFKKAVARINALRSLFDEEEPPEGLIQAVQCITAEILAYLKKHPRALYDLQPRQFEELIAEILASFGWQVQLSQVTRDGGYDIYAITKEPKADVQTSWIIECKKYKPERKVGIEIIRQLHSVKMSMKVACMMLATTSHFTRDAKAFKASRYDLELKGYEELIEWLNEYRPNPKGRLYIKDNQLILPKKD